MKNVAKAIWIGLVILCILLAAAGVVISVRKLSPYYSYPKTEATILKVENYQVRSEGSETRYKSQIQLEYTVNGQKIQSWAHFNRDTTLSEGTTITIAYDPDNPSRCYAKNGGLNPTTLAALVIVLICIGGMFRKALRRR